MRVTAPDGRAWDVTRRPGRSPTWHEFEPLGSGLSLDADGGGDLLGILLGLVIALVFSIALTLFILFLLPLILFVGEAVVIVAGLMLFAGPWRIEAATVGPPPELHSWRVRGLWRSRRAVREVATELEQGVDAAPEDAEP